MLSQASVCSYLRWVLRPADWGSPSFLTGGTSINPNLGVPPSFLMGGTPSKVRGYTIPGQNKECPRVPPIQVRYQVRMGTETRTGWRYPIIRTGWVTPWSGLNGVPPPGLDGVSPVRTGWGTPRQDWMGYPPSGLDGVPSPHQTGWGYLPHQETEQHSKHFLHSRRYASCIHAVGLSCVHICPVYWCNRIF